MHALDKLQRKLAQGPNPVGDNPIRTPAETYACQAILALLELCDELDESIVIYDAIRIISKAALKT